MTSPVQALPSLSQRLWVTLQALPPHEKDELKYVIGHRLIEDLEDLSSEIQVLTDVLVQDGRDLPPILEPKFQRETLERKVQLLLTTLKNDGGIEFLGRALDPRSAETVSFFEAVERKTRFTSGLNTPDRPLTRGGDSDTYSQSKRHANLLATWQDEASVKEIRHILTNEREELNMRLNELHKLLDEERTLWSRDGHSIEQLGPPSIKDLTKLANVLEKMVLSTPSPHFKTPPTSASSCSSIESLSRTKPSVSSVSGASNHKRVLPNHCTSTYANGTGFTNSPSQKKKVKDAYKNPTPSLNKPSKFREPARLLLGDAVRSKESIPSPPTSAASTSEDPRFATALRTASPFDVT